MTYQILSYLKFLKRSTNQHGVHSPFVYKLITDCFYHKTPYPEYKLLTQHRQELSKDHELIQVQDFGAGSRVFRSNIRKVSDIAKTAGIRRKRQQLLFRLVKYIKPKTVLELGTSLGISTLAMALGTDDAEITSVEGCPQTAQKAKDYMKELEIDNIDIHTTDFYSFLSKNKSTYEFIYVDGNHSKAATLSIFESLLSKAGNDCIIIFDDIYWSKEMGQAWEIIAAHPKVTVSIDTFQWGMVFFRKEQAKEHFVIRV